jgi:L-threonylcarbamoyladenylate synthase
MTITLTVDPLAPDPGVIRQAAAMIQEGGLVAFPTETVYGLGANALDAIAVGRIFEVKGRPPTNPVIVHIASPDEALNVASVWPETASRLAGRFWPGPLTLVVPKRPEVPDIVTAGGPTVALRCPSHPIARALIQAAGVPIAAPSANRSTELSPTRAEHVLKGLNTGVGLLLDGGPCSGGIESTVVDVTGGVVRVLRPGLITAPMLEMVVGRVESGCGHGAVARSPGQMARHYSPRTPVLLCTDEDQPKIWDELRRKYHRAGMLRFDSPGLASALAAPRDPSGEGPEIVQLSSDPQEAATQLYEALHVLDRSRLEIILIVMPPDTPAWAGTRDRLCRAGAYQESPGS